MHHCLGILEPTAKICHESLLHGEGFGSPAVSPPPSSSARAPPLPPAVSPVSLRRGTSGAGVRGAGVSGVPNSSEQSWESWVLSPYLEDLSKPTKPRVHYSYIKHNLILVPMSHQVNDHISPCQLALVENELPHWPENSSQRDSSLASSNFQDHLMARSMGMLWHALKNSSYFLDLYNPSNSSK